MYQGCCTQLLYRPLNMPNVFVAKAAESVALVAVNPLWTRLSSREGVTAPALHQTVPASLEDELRGWIYYNVSPLPDDGKRLMIRLDLVVLDSYKQDYARAYATYEQRLRERAQKIQAEQAARETARQADGQSNSTAVMLYSLEPNHPYPPSPPNPQPRFLAYGTSTDQLLDIIDGLLALLPYKPAPPASNDPVVLLVRRARKAMGAKDQREVLQRLLDDGHMIYRVRPDGLGLERRVSPLTHAQAITAAGAATQAGFPAAEERLLAAWNAIYALKPDPSGAYRDAIRAVEAVANPLFLPAAQAPTLGQVIRHLDQRGSDYEMVIANKAGSPADVNAVLGMMRLLWEGHRDRHEGGPTTAPITPESAQTAVAIAVTLVHLLATGSVRDRVLAAGPALPTWLALPQMQPAARVSRSASRRQLLGRTA